MSDAQLKQFLDPIRTLMAADKENSSPGAIKGDVADWVAARAKDEDRVRAARKRLVESGLAEENVKQFPAPQVILLDEKLDYEIHRDEVLTMTAVPYWEAEKTLAAGDEDLNKGEHLFLLVAGPHQGTAGDGAARPAARPAPLRRGAAASTRPRTTASSRPSSTT